MNLLKNIKRIESELASYDCKLIIVTKTKPVEILKQVYDLGYRTFGENRVQELTEKYEALPKDIEWHLIGHLQSNKIKYIASFVTLIHSVESWKLLEEINKQALKHNRIIDCLLQIYIATEETKFGLSEEEALEILNHSSLGSLKNIRIVGLMGMATNTSDTSIVQKEFKHLKSIFDKFKTIKKENVAITQLSMGMSQDYLIAAGEGSTFVRIGSAVFA